MIPIGLRPSRAHSHPSSFRGRFVLRNARLFRIRCRNTASEVATNCPPDTHCLKSAHKWIHLYYTSPKRWKRGKATPELGWSPHWQVNSSFCHPFFNKIFLFWLWRYIMQCQLYRSPFRTWYMVDSPTVSSSFTTLISAQWYLEHEIFSYNPSNNILQPKELR